MSFSSPSGSGKSSVAAKYRQRGKSLERWVAGRLGWRRRSHGEHGGYDDVVPPEGGLAPVSIECKAHEVLQLRTSWIDQARQNAGTRPWALVQRPLGWKEPIVTIGFGFFKELLEAAGITPTTEVTNALPRQDEPELRS